MKSLKSKVIRVLWVVAAAILLLLLFLVARPRQEPKPDIYLSVASEIKELVRLTTVEGERVVPVRYSRGGVAAFGIGHYRIRISFDVEHVQQRVVADTLYLLLPPAEVRILEHEEGGFTLFDVWGENIATRLLGVSLSLEAENEMKAEAMAQLRKELCRDGTVERAQSEAMELLHQLFGMLPGTVIVMEDPLQMPPEEERRLDQPMGNPLRG